jgi:hypothetical protein
MMEDEKLQLLTELFGELKTGQEGLKNDMKSEMSAVMNGIENSISDNISALETKINAGQEELRQEINVFQERIKDIEAGQAEFEERVTRNHEDPCRKWRLARTVGPIRQESLKVIPCGRTARLGKRKSPDIARIDNAAYQVQCHLRAKMIGAHVGRLAPYLWGCSGRAALRREQCDIYEAPPVTRQQLSLNNVNKQDASRQQSKQKT